MKQITPSEKLFYFVSFWADRFGAFAVASIAAFVLFFGVLFFATTPSPDPGVSSISVAVVESSRDINGAPMAVVEMPNGSEEFLAGIYTTGDAAEVRMSTDGEIVQPNSVFEYWALFIFLLLIGALLGALAALPAHGAVESIQRRMFYRRFGSGREAPSYSMDW